MSRGIVTRTIRTLAINCVLADIQEYTLTRKLIYLPYKPLKRRENVERYVRKNFKDKRYKFVSVESWETAKTLYGCKEEHFMQFAEPYDVKTRKPIEEKEI